MKVNNFKLGNTVEKLGNTMGQGVYLRIFNSALGNKFSSNKGLTRLFRPITRAKPTEIGPRSKPLTPTLSVCIILSVYCPLLCFVLYNASKQNIQRLLPPKAPRIYGLLSVNLILLQLTWSVKQLASEIFTAVYKVERITCSQLLSGHCDQPWLGYGLLDHTNNISVLHTPYYLTWRRQQ